MLLGVYFFFDSVIFFCEVQPISGHFGTAELTQLVTATPCDLESGSQSAARL